MDIVGEKEIAERLKVAPNTVHQWSKRALLPAADGRVSGMPAWHWNTVERWARATGRLPGLRVEILTLLGRTSSSTSPLAAQLIAAGYAKSVGQVWQVLNDLMDEGLVGRAMPENWLITEAGRGRLVDSQEGQGG
jgi:hypothetical protein